MKNTKSARIFFVLILALFAFVSVPAQSAGVFSEAKGFIKNQQSEGFDKWNFSIGESRYEINNNGKAKRTSGKNVATNFLIKINKDEVLGGKLYFFDYKNDLLLISETFVADGAGGLIVRLDGKTLKTKWQQHIPAFNIVKGVVENDSVYLAAIGYAARINLGTGKHIWKHEDFYRKYKETGAFNILETPKIIENLVVLTENQDNFNRPPNVIKFDKRSGKVIEVKVN